MAFASVEEIEKQYAEAMKRAESKSEVKAQLQVEKAQALADFRLRALAERERKLWLRDALHDFPLAEEFPELVQGDDEAALRQSAEQLHNRLFKRFEAHTRKQEMDRIVKAHLEGGNNQNPAGTPNADPDP